MQQTDTPRWYALWTRSRHEKIVRDHLASEGVEQLLPTMKRLSRWQDRRKEIEEPLFPGYCFARFALENRLPVLKVPGVAGIVGGVNGPEAIPEAEMESVRALITSFLSYDAHPYLREGMEVEVIRGPLAGLKGILLQKKKHYRLVISVHLIQQSASVEIDADQVVPLRPAFRPVSTSTRRILEPGYEVVRNRVVTE